ncbi:Rv1157c family protein, partial [Mycobacterium persicum]|uniref:Rv1157c family protein n=1 Tax=Mycobacterium persicum TaxID=1487726 RepID=UPI0040535B83
ASGAHRPTPTITARLNFQLAFGARVGQRLAEAREQATREVTAAPGFGPDAPPTQDFMYPSIGTNCLADGSNVIATALSVAGPAKIPSPGPGPGQTAYVFTAVGTPGPAEVQRLPLNVTWVNLTTGRSGSATLKPRPDINPDGPTTLTVIADTGSGSIMSTIFGQVTTKERQCQFMPTIGSTVVP